MPNRLRHDKGRRASAGLFRLAYFVMMSAWGYAVGHLVHGLDSAEQRLRGGAWIVTGISGLAVMWSALTRGPTLRGDASPLEAGFLETLPLRETSRLTVGLLERLFVYALGVSALAGVAPSAPARALGAAIVFSTAGVFTGEALMRLARIIFPAMTIARARSHLLVFGQVLFLMCVVQAPSLARSARLGVIVAGWPSYVAEAIYTGRGFALVLGAALVLLVLALVTVGVAERVGYDKIDLVPTDRPRRSKGALLVIDRIDDVLRTREPGGRLGTVLMTGYTTVVTASIVAFAWATKSAGGPDASAMVGGACGVAVFGAFVVVTARASRMATRDVAARPLLAPLPIEPRALLGGKVIRLRRDALLVAFPVLGLLATPWSVLKHVEIAWRVGALLLAVVLAAKAAASIAFLTVGAGSKRGPGGSFVVESVLVLVPLVGVTTAPHAWSAVVPLAALALVAREAGKSGLRCVRWLDDADAFERETPVWRALLVLGAFHCAQVLTGRLVGLGDLEEGTKLAIAYAVSSLALVGLTAHARRDAPRMRALPNGRGWLAGGAVVGLASAALGLGYLTLLRRFEVQLPQPSGASRVAIGIMAVGLAPIAEEIFFRGWLLPCIEEELDPARRRWLAPLLSAFAFAAVHPPLSFIPVFALGLGASLLFSRTRALGPGIVAHLVHNGIAVLLAG
ncbi:MAG TPA: CPBP family intramembrane glutamic endopeptidase [Labilithrix sp.]|nr:CPBP family intramembrane glutamic endopeptidase [Labilithrix sp.]